MGGGQGPRAGEYEWQSVSVSLEEHSRSGLHGDEFEWQELVILSSSLLKGSFTPGHVVYSGRFELGATGT